MCEQTLQYFSPVCHQLLPKRHGEDEFLREALESGREHPERASDATEVISGGTRLSSDPDHDA